MRLPINLILKGCLYAGVLIQAPDVIIGQNVTDVAELTEQKLEQTGSSGDDTPDLSEIDERLRTLMEHPLNINRSDESAMRESGLFHPQQVSGILRHRELFGPLVSIHELQVIPGFDPGFIRSIMPFVTTGTALDAPNATWKRMIREGSQHVLLRTQLVPETKAGYLTYYGPPAYEGSPVGLLVRYRFRFMNKLVIENNGQKTWIFHGDVFDVTMQHARWLTQLGSIGYDLLIHINAIVNWTLQKMGREKISLSKRIKNSVKKAVSFINHFEKTCADIAIANHYDFVACGHIHHPEIKEIETEKGKVTYLNSGDWVENLTALECHNGNWSLFRYRDHVFPEETGVHEEDSMIFAEKSELFNMLLRDIHVTGTNP